MPVISKTKYIPSIEFTFLLQYEIYLQKYTGLQDMIQWFTMSSHYKISQDITFKEGNSHYIFYMKQNSSTQKRSRDKSYLRKENHS